MEKITDRFSVQDTEGNIVEIVEYSEDVPTPKIATGAATTAKGKTRYETNQGLKVKRNPKGEYEILGTSFRGRRIS